jgi:hypothetical protein
MAQSIVIESNNIESSIIFAKSYLEDVDPEDNSASRSTSEFIHINEPTVSIDHIRDLQKSLSYKPYSGKIRVILISILGKISDSAQNAMLKILEENQSHTLIILQVPNSELLLKTILSRCIIKKGEHIYENFYDIKNFLSLPLQERLLLVNSIENTKGFIQNLISYIIASYKTMGENSKKNSYIVGIMKDWEQAIANNVPEKLILEDIAIQI